MGSLLGAYQIHALNHILQPAQRGTQSNKRRCLFILKRRAGFAATPTTRGYVRVIYHGSSWCVPVKEACRETRCRERACKGVGVRSAKWTLWS
ncbi:hypothetical protein E2C01_068653 [Portunus trituberculatus]|uniref:Uncharacterized protein n=1 Tax=Portunus trituberculatus TaxID=210409 RepID=A0A5B7HX41_PORTR|nr:hypothetical protein [Portunus trituberculatus]